MVAYSAQYVPYLLEAQHNIAAELGVDIMTSDLQTYRVNMTNLALLSMVMKAVQDLAPATATDAFWQQRLGIAIDTGPGGDKSGWPGWVVLQIQPANLATYGGLLTDGVAALQAKIDAWKLANPDG